MKNIKEWGFSHHKAELRELKAIEQWDPYKYEGRSLTRYIFEARRILNDKNLREDIILIYLARFNYDEARSLKMLSQTIGK